MTSEQLSLRERTRRAVQREIGEAAMDLFVTRGYDATTIDDIAAAVGMSQRSVFRYFATKEDIVVGKFDIGMREMTGILRARPADEEVWVSLRRVFDIADGPDQDANKSVLAVVFGTPALLAVYLQRLHTMEDAILAVLVERAREAGDSREPGDLTLRTLTAAAFGCVVAAQHAWLESATAATFGGYLDQAMATVIPNGGGVRRG